MTAAETSAVLQYYRKIMVVRKLTVMVVLGLNLKYTSRYFCLCDLK